MKRCIRIEYRPLNSDETREYVLCPFRVIFSKKSFYLVCRNEERGATVLFALQRVRGVTLLESTFDYPVPDLNELFAFSYSPYISEKPLQFKISFTKDAELYLKETIQPLSPKYTTDAGKRFAEFTVCDMEEICKDLFYFGPNVEILAPSQAREHMKKMLSDTLSQYR